MLTQFFESRAGSIENPSVPLSQADWDDFFGDAGSSSDAGVRITPRKALTYSPFWMAVKMISGDCSKIPLRVFRRRASGGRDHDRRHQSARFIRRYGRANADCSGLQLWRRHFAAALIYERAYIWIDRDDLGRIRGLYNLLSDRTMPTRDRSGSLWYVTEVIGPNGRPTTEALPGSNVIALQGLNYGDDPPKLVKQARHDLGLALRARSFTSKFFGNGAHQGGVLQLPPGYTKTAKDKIEKGLHEQRHDPGKWFKTMVLRDGYRFYTTTSDLDKAETTAIDEQEVRHVARWFMLNPSRLGVKDSVSYNSEEAARKDYHDTALSYWLCANAAECNLKLLTERQISADSHTIDYQINALLWADAKTRNEIAVKGIQAGRFSPNETRDWENLNPRDDDEGDRFQRPMNITIANDDDDESDPDVPPETPPADDDTPNDEATRSIYRDLFGAACRRYAKRLAVQLERAGDHIATRRETEHRNRSIGTEMIAEVTPAIATAGVDIDARQAAETIGATALLDRPLDVDRIVTEMTDIFFPEPSNE